MFRLIIFFTSLLLIVGSAASAQMEIPLFQPRQLMATYSKGVEKIFATLPVTALSPHRTLWANLIWTEVRPNDEAYVIRSGDRKYGAVLVPDPNWPYLSRPGPILAMTPNFNGYNVIFIRPNLMSEIWAGIFMIHELTHLSDVNAKRTDSVGEEEFRAYTSEKQAANGVTRGDFNLALNRFIEMEKIASVDDCIKLRIKLKDDSRPFANFFFPIFDNRGLSSQPLSVEELQLRFPFLIVSIFLRAIETNKIKIKNPKEGFNLLEKLLDRANNPAMKSMQKKP